MGVNFKFSGNRFCSRWILFFVFLLICVIVFLGSFYVLMMRNSADQATPPSLVDTIHGETEAQLKNAINNAVNHIVISLDKDIILTGQLIIPANKSVTLTSSNEISFFNLIGADEHDAIFVEGGGVLTLESMHWHLDVTFREYKEYFYAFDVVTCFF